MLKVKNAYYCRQLPTQLLIILEDGNHYLTNVHPFRHITQAELTPIPLYDTRRPERFYDEYDCIPDYILPFYGLQVKEAQQ